ncbi:hypothetical protein V6N13_013028 [Hibiscus sabdariffa]
MLDNDGKQRDPHDTLNTSYYSYTSTILGFMKLVNLESRFDFPHNFIVSAQQYKICGQRFQLPVNADVLKKLVALVNCSESDNAELCGGDEDERFGLDCISGEHSVKSKRVRLLSSMTDKSMGKQGRRGSQLSSF